MLARRAGEFGGVLWWISRDLVSRQKLAEDNIVGLAVLAGRVVVLAGLSHLGSSREELLELSRSREA